MKTNLTNFFTLRQLKIQKTDVQRYSADFDNWFKNICYHYFLRKILENLIFKE